jgi:hypothetical protein
MDCSANEPFARGYPCGKSQVELFGETPNGLSAGSMLPGANGLCQCYSSGSPIRAPHIGAVGLLDLKE